MIYEFLQPFLAKPEYRTPCELTDIEPSEAHKYNYQFSKRYIVNKKILDVGCWTGQFEKLAMKNAKEIIAIDPNAEAIKLARATTKGPEFLQGTATKLQFKSQAFDVVTFFDVLEHIPIRTEYICLKEIYRVLKPNGVLLLCTPHKHLLSVVLDPSFWSQGHRHYSREELERMLLKLSFKIERIFTFAGPWNSVAYVASMFIKHVLQAQPRLPVFMKKKMRDEFKPGGGVGGIFIVARKNQSL